jgi:hypothetical protein
LVGTLDPFKLQSSTTNVVFSHTCKTRHSRCDEKKPICGNCLRLNLECKQSDFIAPSSWTTTTTEEFPTRAVPTSLDVRPFLPDAPISTWDVFRPRISGLDLASEESPPDDILAYVDLLFPPSTPTLPPTREPPVSLTPETAFLLQTYLRTVATWMDLMDHSKTYELCIPQLTLTSPLLFHCVCAFTAKHLSLSDSRKHSSWAHVASQHYGESLRLLIHALNAPSYEHALTATILLSSYEILAGIASEHHRRHLLGQTMLLKHNDVTAQSTGIDRANFWVHVRHEIGFAMATERPLLLDPEMWKVHWAQGETREDVIGNHVLWILARVINLIYGEDGSTEAGKEKRAGFLQELEQWRAGLSDTFVGIPYGDGDDEGFKKVFFTVTAAGIPPPLSYTSLFPQPQSHQLTPPPAAAAFWYHVTHILIYTEPILQDPSYKPLVQDQAMRITNIAISEFPDSLRVFASHGLFYAAKHIDGIARKARIWGIMNDVEVQLGYHTRSMVKRLQELVESG